MGGACLFFRYVCPFLHSQTRDGLRGKKSQLKKLLSLFFGVLGWVGWVGLGWLCGGDMFILSVRLSILAFSNWRWFEENCRPNKKKYHLYFLEFLVGLGWVGLGWVGFVGGTCLFFRYVCLLAFSNWRWFEENCRPNEENIIFIFWVSWFGWVGLGWVGFVRKTSSLFFGILGWVGLGWVGFGWDGMGWDGLGWVGLAL